MAHIDPAGGWLPLTQPQLDFWEEFSFHPDEPVSTVAHYIDLSGAVNESALLQAITRTVRDPKSCLSASASAMMARRRSNAATQAMPRLWNLSISAAIPLRWRRLCGA